jgi:hypothetical protein
MEQIVIYGFLGLFVVIAFIYIKNAARSDVLNPMTSARSHLNSLDDFSWNRTFNWEESDAFIDSEGLSGIAINESRDKLCLFKIDAQGIVHSQVFTPGEVVSCEILKEGVTVTKTSRGSQIGGALLGGVVFGPWGAVVGGLSGKKITYDGDVMSLVLRLTVLDDRHPIRDTSFVSRRMSRSDKDLNARLMLATRWQALCSRLTTSRILNFTATPPDSDR